MQFTKRPGEFPVAECEEDYAILVGDSVPDTVTLPPELGGQSVKVIRQYKRQCPVHSGHLVLCYELESGHHVAECDQFYWFTVTPKERPK